MTTKKCSSIFRKRVASYSKKRVIENKSNYKPEFSSQLGFLYPIVWRILSLHRFFSISMYLPKHSGRAIDIYIFVCWVIGAILVCIYAFVDSINRAVLAGFVFIWSYKLFDIYFILLSIFLKGYYRTPGTWLSAKRVVLLILFNAIEVIVVFGFVYHACVELFPQVWKYHATNFTLWDSIYYSFVTGTTLGYGDIYPETTFPQIAAILETSFILLVVLNLVSFARGNASNPVDLENNKENSVSPLRSKKRRLNVAVRNKNIQDS